MISSTRTGLASFAMAGFYLIILIPFVRMSEAALEPVLISKLLAPLLGFLFLRYILFRVTVSCDEKGVSQASLFGKSSLPWDEVRDLIYKPQSYSKGTTYPAWIILKNNIETVRVSSRHKNFHEMEKLIEESLARVGGPKLSEVKEKALNSFWGTVGAPSKEDLAPILLNLGWFFVALFWAVRFL